MFDIITFGSASRDIILASKNFKAQPIKKFITGKGLCLPFGSKIDIEDLHCLSGGGGTNTAVAFTKQGFIVAYCGMVGEDADGQNLVSELRGLGVDVGFIRKTNKKLTNHSVILAPTDRDRTILVYRGAAGELSKEDISWSKLKAEWFYLAPLSGNFVGLFESIVDFAHQNKINVAVNPSNSQLSLPRKKIERILRKTDILILNHEEASFLTGLPYQREKEIFKMIDGLVPGVAIMTKGPKGVVVSDGNYLYRAKILKTKVADRTGAGDSFASGFVSEYIRTKGDIERAIQLGVANSAACLSNYGAKNGLLRKGDKWTKVKVSKESCAKTNFCSPK